MRWRLARLRPGHARPGFRALGAAMAVVGLATLGVGTASGAAPARQDEQDPLALFSAMMPVFSSPRCVNCHGGTNPQTDLNHDGGQVDVPVNEAGDMTFDPSHACLECHTTAPASWRLAPAHMSFVGKDAVTLCRQLRTINGLADPSKRSAFIDHLGGDLLIEQAFIGQGAIGADSAFAPIAPEPPPMSQADFVGAAQNWVSSGQALCGLGWSGTITVTKTSESNSITQGNTVARDAAMKLTETIDVADGEGTGTVNLVQHDFTDSGPKNHDCTTQHLTYTADGKGPSTVQIFLDVPSGTPEQTPQVSESGGVQIFFSAPAATGTVHTERGKNGPKGPSSCVTTQMDAPYSINADYLSARGPVDPNDPDHLDGSQTELSPDKSITTTITWKLTRGQ